MLLLSDECTGTRTDPWNGRFSYRHGVPHQMPVCEMAMSSLRWKVEHGRERFHERAGFSHFLASLVTPCRVFPMNKPRSKQAQMTPGRFSTWSLSHLLLATWLVTSSTTFRKSVCDFHVLSLDLARTVKVGELMMRFSSSRVRNNWKWNANIACSFTEVLSDARAISIEKFTFGAGSSSSEVQ